MNAYGVLGKLKWKGGLGKCMIVIRHRGAPDDEKQILGSSVLEVKKSYFVYKDMGETIIPMHRVLRIKYEGKIIWKRGL